MNGFSVEYRNYGHWDVWQNKERIYRIRGGPGDYWVCSEHSKSDEETKRFKTVQACMSWITDNLMFELLVAEGQTVTVIESWNI